MEGKKLCPFRQYKYGNNEGWYANSIPSNWEEHTVFEECMGQKCMMYNDKLECCGFVNYIVLPQEWRLP